MGIDKIPSGIYCYCGKHICPYWKLETDEDNEPIGYCSYLDEYDYLLLADQCKICGINEGIEQMTIKFAEFEDY